MSLNDTIEQVTQSIVEKSKESRARYLEKIEAAKQHGTNRSRLSCGNLAHGMAACDKTEKSRLAAETAPNIGIISAYNDMLSAHHPYYDYPEIIKQTASRLGATAQFAGGVPAMCDGITQGQDGMELSLFSRDLIAMATAVSLSHNMFDGCLLLGICDKIVPGLMIGALSFGHLPCLFVPAGPMPTGQSNDAKAKVRQDYAEGKVGRKELLASESASYHTSGTCTFYGTANTNQMLMEIMGLHLPGSSFVPPNSPLREALTRYGVKQHLQNIQQNISLASIVTEKSLVNGLVGLLATGGSTNHTIHLIAIAKAAGIQIDWQDMAEISKVVPLLCRVYPNGSADINHFQAAGGMPFLIKQLANAGFLHLDVQTVMGQGLDDYYKEPKLAKNPQADIFREKGKEKHSQWILEWEEAATKSLDESVLTSVGRPFSSHGGLNLLTGNLGRSVIKTSAIADQHLKVKAPAMVFEKQEQLVAAFKKGELNKNFIAVIRFQGPKANGMPELHQLTPILASLQSSGFKVALVTDGRMSGASGKVPAAIHLVPEALDAGPIARVMDGDMIELDAEQGILTLEVDEEEFSKRKSAVKTYQADQQGMGRELFNQFRRSVTNAELGATTWG